LGVLVLIGNYLTIAYIKALLYSIIFIVRVVLIKFQQLISSFEGAIAFSYLSVIA